MGQHRLLCQSVVQNQACGMCAVLFQAGLEADGLNSSLFRLSLHTQYYRVIYKS
jgi:hypothetical protein